MTRNSERRIAERERKGILRKVEHWLEKPMILLGFAWLLLLILELTGKQSRGMEALSTAIWLAFLLEFVLRFSIAPGKLQFLKKSWLTIISLAIPALRVFRIVRVVRLLRFARASRGIRLVRILTSLNRGMSSLGATLHENKFGYVMALSLLITLAGAAGMYAFERSAQGGSGFASFSDALWWTAMIVTTMGSDYWPKTTEGRILCLLISVYAFAVWGYVTATIATFFLGRSSKAEPVRTEQNRQFEKLASEVAALREQISALTPRQT